ncbi:uncharacterized protein JCM15063_001809 [Sporobolomyces koalae]|uniref:uncharacterized protein n=1 Tax=Sporobolomyces koalae TaxID=500713 RepID=UPI00317AB980
MLHVGGFVCLTATLSSLAIAAPLATSNLDVSTLSDQTLALVQSRLAESATDTWTAGTYGEAMLELANPALSVFSQGYATTSAGPANGVISLVNSWASKRPVGSAELAFVQGGASGDPPALGVPWIVAATSERGEAKARLWEQAREQLEYLLMTVPRTPDGAISHRAETVQLWSDFMYMVPPFMGYYGVISQNTTLIAEAVTQLRLYRNYLNSGSKPLRHVVLGDWQDNGLWATGNGWAAAGMVRVAATIQNSQYAGQFANEIGQLKSWAKDILDGSFAFVRQGDGLLPNYFDDPASFVDTAGSALLAAIAYRLAALDHASSTDYTALLTVAAKIRASVNARIDTSTGWLAEAVDPLSFAQQTPTSPEGQAFVLLLHAAYRDYNQAHRI